MLKLIAQIVVAVAIWVGLSSIDIGLSWRIIAILLGAFAVHLVWERLFYDPYLYLGAMPVASDDPIMQAAVKQARTTLRRFLEEIYPHHREDSMAKFRYRTSDGTIENLWGDLLEVNGDRAKVYVQTPPIDRGQPFDRTQEVPLEEIVDWQVEYRDGTLRGGYTNWALFKIYEREEGPLHPKLQEQFERFRELEAPEAARDSSR